MNDTNEADHPMPILTRSVVLIAVLGAITACDDGEVRFGPPNGLRIRGNATVTDACPLPAGVPAAPTPAECAAISWQNEIFPQFFDASPPMGAGAYLCANNGCHAGPNDPTGVNMVIGDAAASYTALANFENGGRPYFSADAADAPYLLCNIDPNTTVFYGTPMPLGPVVTPEHLVRIGTWAACGMPNDSVPGGGPGAGGMGTGGSLGAGGAGGMQ